MAKCIMELERIKGVKQGRGGDTTNPNNSDCTQKALAEQLNIKQDTITNYKKLLNLIPELQQMVENGSMKAKVGYKIWARMSQEEQNKFFNDILVVRKLKLLHRKLCNIILVRLIVLF